MVSLKIVLCNYEHTKQIKKLEQHVAQLSNIARDTSTKLLSAEVNNLLNDPVQINNDQRKIACCQND